MRSHDALTVDVPDAAAPAAACVATLEVDTDGPHADTAWIVPVGHAPREPIECFAVPDGATWDEWARAVDAVLAETGWTRTGRFVRSGPTVTARLVRTATATPEHGVASRRRVVQR